MIKSLIDPISSMQGKLFIRAKEKGYDSEVFIRLFMKSEIAKELDSEYSPIQCMGDKYLLETIEEELQDKLIKSNNLYDDETLYWMGYIYRYWNYYNHDASKDIVKYASPKIMNMVYLAYHSLSLELAVERLKEAYNQKQNIKQNK